MITTTINKSKVADLKYTGVSLSEAKKLAKAESSAQPRKLIYVKVEKDGTWDISGFADKHSAVHCYRNGNEIPIMFNKNKSSADVHSHNVTMAVIKNAKNSKAVPAKKESGKDSKPVAKATKHDGNSGPPLLGNLTEAQYQKLSKVDGKIRDLVATAVIAHYKL